MTQYGFAFNGTYCNGCKTCMLACKDYYDLDEDTDFRKVYEYGGGCAYTDADGMLANDCFGYYISVACNQCDDPACVKVCPTTAMHKDADTGLVAVDTAKCMGCGYCAMACPYGCPTVNRALGHSVKCEGCIDRVKEGKKPICVEACPQRALDFGEIGKLRAIYGDIAQVDPLPDSSYTHPNLTISVPPQAQKQSDSAGAVLNLLEVM